MLNEMKADVARYPGTGAARLLIALRCAGFYAVLVYRFGYEAYHRWPPIARVLGKIVYKPIAFLCEFATGIAIDPGAHIGPGFYIGHWDCIRIGRNAIIGEGCNISPMVTIGFGSRKGRTGTPRLGDRVYIGPGAKIIGPVSVGSDVAIGANAVVCRDVPDHVSVGGVPAKIISQRGSAPYLNVGQRIEVVGSVDDVEDDEPEQIAAMTGLT